MLDILLMSLLGIIAGIFAGIIPGIHSNLLATASLSIYAAINPTSISPLSLCAFIYTLSLVNNFLSFIPSTYLGVPDSGTVLSLMPAHQYLKEGKGHEAVILSLIGAYGSMIASIITLPIFIFLVKISYSFIKKQVPLLLILIALTLILRERKKFFAFYTFLCAGILGIITLNLQRLNEPLLPLLTGLFGMPALISSISTKESPSEQVITFPDIKPKEISKSISISLISGSIFSFLPSLGPSQAAVFSSLITKDSSRQSYLMLIGALNTMSMIISVATFYLINKARNGAIVAISTILPTIDLNLLLFFLAISLIIGYPTLHITLFLSRKFSYFISKTNYQLISIIVMVLIIIISLIISGPLSLLVLFTATAIGFIPQITNVSRNHLMGCLMLSTIMYYLL